MRRALVTGASGQDGYYLTRHLRELGREVVGVSLDAPLEPVGRHVCLDIGEGEELAHLVQDFCPDEIYHLAAYHRSSASGSELSAREEESAYFRINVEATRRLIGSALSLGRECRVFLAGSCHIFGDPEEAPQTERTHIKPNSLYGLTKAMNLWFGRLTRERSRLFVVTGILYNHESPLRGPSFVTGHIARKVAEIARGDAEQLVVGDLKAQVDWGFAGDYVRAMVVMLEAERPVDAIIASGRLHRVEDFVRIACAHVGIDAAQVVRQDPNLHRPVSRSVYHGDISLITTLGWAPRVTFPEMVRMMVDAHR